MAIGMDGAAVGSVVGGKMGSAADTVEAIFLDGAQVKTLQRTAGHTGRLQLLYPNGSTTAAPVRIDVSNLATAVLPYGTRISGFASTDLVSVET